MPVPSVPSLALSGEGPKQSTCHLFPPKWEKLVANVFPLHWDGGRKQKELISIFPVLKGLGLGENISVCFSSC